jgi:hypothetical protein
MRPSNFLSGSPTISKGLRKNISSNFQQKVEKSKHFETHMDPISREIT